MKKTLLVVAVGIASVAAAGQGENASGLDATAVREALDFGRTGSPVPYHLCINSTPTGFVYTPFLRIAIASKAAHEAGRELAANDLAGPLTGPNVYVALAVTQSQSSNCTAEDSTAS